MSELINNYLETEKIISIKEIKNIQIDNDDYTYDGFSITTNRQIIYLLISNQQVCCEDWGYFISEDNLDNFINSTITSIKVTNKCLNVKKLEKLGFLCDVFYDGDIIFIDINTSNGVLQFTAYNGNEHHIAKTISKQLNLEIEL